MGLDVSASLVAGVTLRDFFKRRWEKETSYEEHNAKGEKTGRIIVENLLMAEMPNGDHVVIGEYMNKYNGRLKLDFYKSMGFDGPHHEDHDLELHFSDYDTEDLTQIVIGKEIVSSDSHRSGEKMVVRVTDTEEMERLHDEVIDKLFEIYDYQGQVDTYLINHVSY